MSLYIFSNITVTSISFLSVIKRRNLFEKLLLEEVLTSEHIPFHLVRWLESCFSCPKKNSVSDQNLLLGTSLVPQRLYSLRCESRRHGFNPWLGRELRSPCCKVQTKRKKAAPPRIFPILIKKSPHSSVFCWWVSDSLWPPGCSLAGGSVHGILQARLLGWVATSSSSTSALLHPHQEALQFLLTLSHYSGITHTSEVADVSPTCLDSCF